MMVYFITHSDMHRINVEQQPRQNKCKATRNSQRLLQQLQSTLASYKIKQTLINGDDLSEQKWDLHKNGN